MRLLHRTIHRCIISARNTHSTSVSKRGWKTRHFVSRLGGSERLLIFRGFSSLPCDDDDVKRTYAKASVVENGAKVIVSFDKEAQSAFHAPWLWSNNPSSVHPTSGQRLRTPGGYSWDMKIKAADIVNSSKENAPGKVVLPFPPPPKGSSHPVGNVYKASNDDESPDDSFCLRVTWESSNHEERFISYYDLAWLWQWRYDQESLEYRRARTKVTTFEALKSSDDDGIQTFDYSDMESDPREFTFQLLDAVIEFGAGLVQNAPVDFSDSACSPVAKVGHLLGGSLSHGALYGAMFHVQAVPNAKNIAYTNVSLGPHQDLAYYESKPGLQLLQCISNEGIDGGESVLVDAMAAAEEFRRIAPEHFDVLTKCPATFVKQREGADMIYRRPHIVLDDGGTVVSVNWSPPFEGPLSVSPESVEAYYRAYAAFERMVDNSLPEESDMEPNLAQDLREYAEKYTWERRLETGEILVFNNMRMLHGRRGFSFSGDSGGRHLLGCYTNIDDTLNRYRVIMREMIGGASSRNAGNGTCGMP